MTKSCNFTPAKFSQRTVNRLSTLMGIFYALIICGVLTPCMDCNGSCSCPLDDFATGSGAPFLFSAPHKLNSISAMQSRNEKSLKGKTTPESNTSNSTKTVSFQLEVSNDHGIPVFKDFLNELQKRFGIEMNAKNEAYAFILANGLLDEFSEFCEEINGADPHKLSITILNEKA